MKIKDLFSFLLLVTLFTLLNCKKNEQAATASPQLSYWLFSGYTFEAIKVLTNNVTGYPGIRAYDFKQDTIQFIFSGQSLSAGTYKVIQDTSLQTPFPARSCIVKMILNDYPGGVWVSIGEALDSVSLSDSIGAYQLIFNNITLARPDRSWDTIVTSGDIYDIE